MLRAGAERRWKPSSASSSASQLRPVLLVFQDLHWIDAETQAFLDLLVEDLLQPVCCFSSTIARNTSTRGPA